MGIAMRNKIKIIMLSTVKAKVYMYALVDDKRLSFFNRVKFHIAK